jgi:two-component system LytT family response regulator
MNLVGQAGSVEEAKKLIDHSNPDLLLLDIEMGDGTAFDLLEQLDASNMDIIFTTAFDHYAIRAIQFSAIDYLLKPVDPEDLQSAVERYETRRKRSRDANNHIGYLMHNLHSDKKKIAIPDMDGYIFVDLEDIIHCQSDGSYTRFFLQDGQKILASKSLGDYEQLLGSQQFFRVHRSSLINLSHIKKYIKGEGGYVIMSDGSEVEVSRRKKQDFIKILSGR